MEEQKSSSTVNKSKRKRGKNGDNQNNCQCINDCCKFNHNHGHFEGVEEIMSVGENIRQIRKEQSITQVELAESVGITQAMLCQVERGTKNPSLQVSKAIAEALNVTIDRLLE